MNVLLVGAGQMAVDYSRVLTAIGQPFATVGRSAGAVATYESRTGLAARAGGVTKYLAEEGAPERAIVAVDITNLASVTNELIEAGSRAILIEKPAALASQAVRFLSETAESAGAEVFVAYNRRFYASVAAARRMIHEDDGLLALEFEFTEWIDRLDLVKLDGPLKERWVIANSSHVIDLAFHLAGTPSEWGAWRTGELEWHSSGSRFCGAGITDQGVSFSYNAVWGAPGRWGLTLRTSRRRLRLQPIERLICSLDGVNDADEDLDDALDLEFKPGLHRQVQAFLESDHRYLCSISEHAALMPIYSGIAGYPDE